MKGTFHYSKFFESPGIFTELFNKYENAWEVLSDIPDFITKFRNKAPELGFNEISTGVFIGENVDIDNSAKIEGSAIIGSNSKLGHSSYLRGPVLLGNNVKIGHACEVKNSIILENSAVAHLNYIGDSLLGSSVNISGGAILANMRLDKETVKIKDGSELILTNRHKMGSIVGDGCSVGVNSVLNPGTILGRSCIVFPLVTVVGIHPQGSVIKR